MSAKVSFEPSIPGGMKGSADSAAHVSLSSIFNFQRTDIADAVSWPVTPWLRGRPSVAYAALLNSHKGFLRSKLLRRQRRTALVREAYIVATNQNCQQPADMFLNFLRQKFWSRRTAPGERWGCHEGALLPPHCRSTPRPTNKAPAPPARRLPVRDQGAVCASSVRPFIGA